MIERTPRGFANTTVIVGKQGERNLVYNKISEPAPFTPGSAVPQTATELGMTSVLVCGDLFTEEATKLLPAGTELLLVPMARAFSGRSPDRKWWGSGMPNESNITCNGVVWSMTTWSQQAFSSIGARSQA